MLAIKNTGLHVEITDLPVILYYFKYSDYRIEILKRSKQKVFYL